MSRDRRSRLSRSLDYNAGVFRLTRSVRFVINAAPAVPQAPTNSYGGYPSLNGAGQYFELSATVAGDLNPDSSYLLNIKDIDAQVRARAIPLIEDVLRRHPDQLGPPLLQRLFDELQNAWPPARLERLALALTPFLNISIQHQERPMTRLSQKFEFAASHRLHNPALSEQANRETFGKCNNPHGHGHNYELQVTLIGEPGAATGLLVDVPAFERIVSSTVIDRLDHKNLNVEVAEFRDLIPSVENIARVIYRLLKPQFPGPTRLASVTVWETPKTWCEYAE